MIMWDVVFKAASDVINTTMGGELLNQVFEKLDIDFKLPSIQEMAFAIAKMIAATFAPFLAYVMFLAIIAMVIWRFPELIQPFIKKLADRFGMEIGV